MKMLDQLKKAVEASDDVDDGSTVNISYSDGTTDTITLSGNSLYNSQTAYSCASVCVPCYTIGGGGAGAIGNFGCYTGGGGSHINTNIPGITVGGICNTTWNTGTGGYTINSPPSTVSISTGGIAMAEGTDITVGGRSLSAFMKTMEERLAILVPDPAKMEKFAALKKAYEHYKLMEKLCQEDKEE
jgi:hypothetical protein